MTFQPGQYLLGGVGRNQDVESSLGHPLSGEGAKHVGLSATVWTHARGRFGGLGLGTSSAYGEAEAIEDAPSLMGGEVGPIEPGNETDYLLRRITAAAHHDEVIRDRVRQDVFQRPGDLIRLEIEPVPSDGGTNLSQTL